MSGRLLVFGDVVREHRRRLGMSQQELADLAGLSVRGLRKIETNRVDAPRPGTVRLLADALGLRDDDRERFCSTALTDSGDTGDPGTAPPGTTHRSDASRRSDTGRRPAVTRPAPARPVVPAQLPADIGGFAGRTEPLRRLSGLLDACDGGGHRTPTSMVITVITGTAGVGKTALAVHWAHQVRRRFPDGQLYVNLRGFDPTGAVMDSAEAVRRFLDALDVACARIPTGLPAQAALYRSVLANRRVLILLDNARDAEQVRPLLPGTPGCVVVITSRNQLTSLVAAEGACPVPLDLLTRAESRDLLAERLGWDRVAAESAAADAIVDACARLPLALAITSARAQQTGFPLTALAAELAQTRVLLDVLSAGDPSTEIRAVFSWSLAAVTPPAARLLRLLGLHPGPDITAPVAASLAGAPRPEVRRLLTDLANANLLSPLAPGRYALHDLLRAYAADLAVATDPHDVRHAAAVRVLDHYAHTAQIADRLLYPTRDPIPVPLAAPAPGTDPERLTDHRHAMGWLTAARPALLAALRHAADTGADIHAWQLAWSLDTFLTLQGRWHEEADAWRLALAAADRLGDPTAIAVAHRVLSCALIMLGDYDDAHAHLRRALELHGRTGDLAGQAHTHYNLAMLWDRRNRPTTALEHAVRALDLYRSAGHRRGQASALNGAGWILAALGDLAQALVHCEQALALYQQLGDREGEAATWDSLGYTSHASGDHAAAIGCYGHAIALFQELGARFNEALILTHLGDTHHAAADVQAAGDAWRQALDILTDLDHPNAEDVHAKLRSLAATAAGPVTATAAGPVTATAAGPVTATAAGPVTGSATGHAASEDDLDLVNATTPAQDPGR